MFKVHSQKKLNSYIHHVVSNSLPPTAQVGGAVIKSPRLPLPPIQIPNTAPPMIITAPSKKTIPQTHKDPADTDKNGVGSGVQGHTSKEPIDTVNNEADDALQGHTNIEPVDTEVDSILQNDSNPSVDSDAVKEMNDHDNDTDITTSTTTVSSSTENLESSVSPIKVTETTSISTPKADSYRQKVKPQKSPVITKSPKNSLKHKRKVLPSTLSSPPLLDSSNNGDHSSNRLAAEPLQHSDDKDDKILPALRGRNVKLLSQFDVVTSLTGAKR